jgi:hypothetical protein
MLRRLANVKKTGRKWCQPLSAWLSCLVAAATWIDVPTPSGVWPRFPLPTRILRECSGLCAPEESLPEGIAGRSSRALPATFLRSAGPSLAKGRMQSSARAGARQSLVFSGTLTVVNTGPPGWGRVGPPAVIAVLASCRSGGNAGNSKINTLGHHSPREYWLKPPISKIRGFRNSL